MIIGPSIILKWSLEIQLFFISLLPSRVWVSGRQHHICSACKHFHKMNIGSSNEFQDETRILTWTLQDYEDHWSTAGDQLLVYCWSTTPGHAHTQITTTGTHHHLLYAPPPTPPQVITHRNHYRYNNIICSPPPPRWLHRNHYGYRIISCSLHPPTHMNARIHAHKHMHTHMHACMHTNTHTYIHIHITHSLSLSHTHTPSYITHTHTHTSHITHIYARTH